MARTDFYLDEKLSIAIQRGLFGTLPIERVGKEFFGTLSIVVVNLDYFSIFHCLLQIAKIVSVRRFIFGVSYLYYFKPQL